MVAAMVEIRPCTSEEDEQRSLEIYNAVWPRDAVTMAEVDSFKKQALAYADHLALVDGDAVGSGVAAVLPQRPDRVFTLITVLADSRRQGAGTAIYRAISRWAAERDLDAIETIVAEDDDASLAFAIRRGFAEIERNGRMVLDLTGVRPPAVDPPGGIEIRTWAERPDASRGLYEVYTEAMPDIPGQRDDEIEAYDDWLEHSMRGSGDRDDATFVALAGDEVVGFAKFSLTAAQPRVAFHDLTGVRRAWRGRGIAGALKRAQIAWAKANGFERLSTQNEMRNEPIRRLNERLGYKPEPGRIFLLGRLANGQAGSSHSRHTS